MSTAATAESTPPDSPQITLPLPTWRRIFSIASSLNARMVQSPAQPAILRTKLRRSAAPCGRVHDFGMKLHAVEFALVVGDHGDRRVGRRASHDKALGQLGDAVAVAHPHRIALADLPDAFGQRGGFGHLDLGAAEFAMVAALDLAAELRRHGLFAVADAEHRHAGLIDRRRRERRVLVERRSRPAGEDDAFRLHLGERASAFWNGTISQ